MLYGFSEYTLTGATKETLAQEQWYRSEQCWNCDAPSRRKQKTAGRIKRLWRSIAPSSHGAGKLRLAEQPMYDKQ